MIRTKNMCRRDSVQKEEREKMSKGQRKDEGISIGGIFTFCYLLFECI